ncbi:MAG: GDSL-type esterase/lipase family protein [Candidatus Lernaella stagnicola]|nr:GDSL-type esterase/lipase family protein [Candidatus Lernaella stagnicola]
MNVPRRRQLLYAVIVAVVFFAAAEGVARLALRTATEPALRPDLYFFSAHSGFVADDHLFWRMPPRAVVDVKGREVHSNAFGLRDHDFPLEKPRGEIRILSIGESGTFGEGVERDETYTQRLEAKLRAAYPKQPFEAINAGLPSYTSFQGMTYLRREGLRFSPDLVLVYFSGNDFLPSYFVDDTAQAAGQPTRYGRGFSDREVYQRRFLIPGWTTLRRSGLVRILAPPLLGAERRLRQTGRVDPHTKLPVRVPDADRRFTLTQIVRLSRGAGAKVLLLLPPYGNWLERDPILLEIGRTLDVPVLDLKQVRLDYDDAHFGEDEMSTFFLDPMHPSVLGHKVCAEAIFAFIVERHLLPLEAAR